MKDSTRKKLTRLEMQIMDALWGLEQASIKEIQEAIPKKIRPEYTTVQTIIYRLEEKGAVIRIKKIGNAHIFEPQIDRKLAVGRVVDDVLEMLGGSTRPLLTHLVESKKVDLSDLQEMEKLLNAIQEK